MKVSFEVHGRVAGDVVRIGEARIGEIAGVITVQVLGPLDRVIVRLRQVASRRDGDGVESGGGVSRQSLIGAGHSGQRVNRVARAVYCGSGSAYIVQHITCGEGLGEGCRVVDFDRASHDEVHRAGVGLVCHDGPGGSEDVACKAGVAIIINRLGECPGDGAVPFASCKLAYLQCRQVASDSDARGSR